MIPFAITADSDDYPPLSALNDLLFCERRCFLHRVEGLWVENVHTMSGTLGHQRAHNPQDSSHGPKKIARGLRLISHALKIQGVADLVEFEAGTVLPVEYKRGRRRKWDNDDVQLCAQAICLEEMLGCTVSRGAIFHLTSKRRREVDFTAALRAKTAEAAQRLHRLIQQNRAPAAYFQDKCKQCSLYQHCLPEILSAQEDYRQIAKSLFIAEPSD